MTPESTGIDKTPPEQPGRLAGQVAIVTGGTSGIGQQACLALAREGTAVVVVGRDSTRLSATVAAVESVSRAPGFSRRVLGLPLNVCQAADMESMARQTLEHFGRIDILIASAGILRSPNTRPTMLLELSARQWDKVVDTNLTGVFLSNRAVLKTMREQRRGQIINISSLTGRRAVPFDTPYSASKFGVMGLTAALAQEMMPYGVRVQVLLPGDTATPIWAQNEPLPPAAQTIPASRVADLIVFMLTWPYDSTLGELAIAPLGGTAKVPWRLGLPA
jgi:NAD(P)-dependent dehydrogenase (short-subunit alcohol dehydrogenase family)